MALTFYPEGTTVLSSDNELRTLHKIASLAASGGAGGGGGAAGFSGNGSPEGVVTANPGATYVRIDTGGFWYKATGTGTNTGWIAGIA